MNELKTITTDKGVYDSFPDQTAREGLRGKLAAPEGLKPGDYLRVKSVSEGGTVTLEGAEADSGQNANGLSSTASALLITILRNGVYSTNQSANITALEAALGGTGGGSGGEEEPDVPVVKTYAIFKELVNVSSSNAATSVNENASYTATLTADEGYVLESVTITMGGVDVTASVYVDGVISIPAVTGDVEIVASATEEQTASGELVTESLVFDFDFRNTATESEYLTGWGDMHRIADKAGAVMLLGPEAATADEKGLDCYDFRVCRYIANETEDVRLGNAYTVQALYAAKSDTEIQPNLFNWGTGTNNGGQIILTPKYFVDTTSTSAEALTLAYEGGVSYLAVTYVVDGESLSVYINGVKQASLDGANYDGFTKWMDYGCPNTTWKTCKQVAFVGYNRALSETEIVDNLAYFKTLEVSA